MSSQEDKEKHSKRLYSDEVYIARQEKIAKAYGLPAKEPHRYHKLNCLTCGNSNCVMCGNPRKMLNEKTIQERSFEQKELND